MSFSQGIIREHQIPSTKFFWLGFVVLVFFTCCKKASIAISETNGPEILKTTLVLNQIEGRWYHNNKPFNGFAVQFHKNGCLAERVGFLAGKKHGISQKWFDSGQQRSQSYYLENRLHGKAMSWWPNGVKSIESNYKTGIRNGIQKKWYPSGQLARLTQLKNGIEEGLQQAWLRNGKIYANYEAKNGRFFGLKRSNLCYQLKDEIVQK